MITNLFSVFDPSSSIGLGLNWMSIGLGLLVYPLVKWRRASRAVLLRFTFHKILYKEVNPLFSNKSKVSALIFIAIFFFILWINLIGLIPYIFTPTSHLVITLRLALPLWMGYFSYGWVKNLKWILAHLIPQGTPVVLIPFIVLIESVSRVIRPITLSVRLMANIIAGHLLLTLIRGAIQVEFLRRVVGIRILQVLLVVLEVAVAAIQAYVLVVLRVLYTREV